MAYVFETQDSSLEIRYTPVLALVEMYNANYWLINWLPIEMSLGLGIRRQELRVRNSRQTTITFLRLLNAKALWLWRWVKSPGDLKEDILEQLVNDYLKFKGFFTAHNPAVTQRHHPALKK